MNDGAEELLGEGGEVTRATLVQGGLSGPYRATCGTA